jgi:hypothetical protein
VRNRAEQMGSTNELVIGVIVIVAGVTLYFLNGLIRRRQNR